MRTIFLPLLVLFPLVLALPATARVPKGLSDLLEKKTFAGPQGGSLPYRLLKSDHPEEGKTYPLVVFLHGAGERGSDNEKQLTHGVAEFARADNRKKYPCFLVAPQCPAGQGWVNVNWGAASHRISAKPARNGALVLELIDALRKEYPIDPNRIYLTGLSMGGYGTWDLLMRRPELFAAAVPICGGGDDSEAAKIAKIPVWVFHGARDQAVKVERSRTMVAALKKAGGQPRYTEYPDVAHDSWVPAYRTPELMEWLFAQKKE
jgi:predicted peptidase